MALAERALALAGPEAQVTAFWEVQVRGGGADSSRTSAMGVELVCLDRGVGRASTADTEDAGLAEAASRARRAAADAAEPRAAELPEPAPGRPHDGWDPAVLALDPAQPAAELRPRHGDATDVTWRGGAARTAVVSTRGVSAFEQRTFLQLRLARSAAGRTVSAVAAGTGPGRMDAEAAGARPDDLSVAAEPVAPAAGESPAVLGPAAVAVVLDSARAHFGVLAAERRSVIAESLARRVVAPAINLSDSPRFPGTLPRSYDAEGMPRQPVPLVQDGVAHRLVRDCASPGGPSTGHATIPLRAAPAAQHLVLVGGGAADEQELISQIERGIYVPALSPDGRRLMGAFAIEDGRRGAPLLDAAVDIDGMAVLAWVQALTMSQQLVATDDPSARTIGASMCPALRALGGVHVAG